jgi:hypothetical protein
MHSQLPKQLKERIRSIVVREFEGIDDLPDDPKDLLR